MAKLNIKIPAFRAPIDIARSYIEAGVPVFPCHECEIEEIDQATGEIITRPEKSPYTPNGLNGATRSERIVKIWFGERYIDAAIGVPTGESLGAWVLDIDKHGDRDGYKWLEEMEKKHGKLPPTATAKTANGGTHIFFKHVKGVRNRAAIAPGVDTRGDGGYIVAPGSLMADGRSYAWLNHDGPGLPPFADAPQWLLDLVIAKAPTTIEARADYVYSGAGERSSKVYVERSFEDELRKASGAPIGQRGQQLYASACAIGEFVAAGLIGRSDAESEIYNAAVASGVAAKDGERQTRDRIRRGLDKTRNSPRVIPELEYENDNTPLPKPEKITDFIERSKAKKAQKDATSGAEQEGATTDDEIDDKPKPRRERFEKTWFSEIKEGEPKEMFVKGAFGVREFTTVSGLPGTGKSVIITDAACHVASGMEWHGRKVKQGLVVYVAAERKKLTERRMMAFRKRYGAGDIPLLVLGGRLDFTRDLKDARDLITAIKEAEIESGQECIWVILDTLTRVFGAGDQNASKDMTKFVQSCDEILMSTTAHVTAIHHSAWSGERGKGAIDLDGAVDASFMVKKDHGKYKLICDGTNDGEEGDIVCFAMDSVTLGHDEDGEPTTAPVVVKSEDAKLKKSSEAQAGKNARALELLVDLINEYGVDPETPGYPEGAMVVDIEMWRQSVYSDAGEQMTPQAKRQRFNRVKKDLISDGSIGENATWVWVVPEGAAA